MNRVTIKEVYLSPDGNVRIVQRSDTTYFYPQLLESSILEPTRTTWHYLHDTRGDKESFASITDAKQWFIDWHPWYTLSNTDIVKDESYILVPQGA